jgi:hypothetical protein
MALRCGIMIRERRMMKLRCGVRIIERYKEEGRRYKLNAEGEFVLCGKPAITIIDGTARCAEHLYHGPRAAGKSVFLDE